MPINSGHAANSETKHFPECKELIVGRFYSVPFSAVAVSAAQDLFEVQAATGKPFVLHEVIVAQASDYGDSQAEGLSVLIKRATGSYTSGSGGSTVTPAKHLTNDAAAGPTAELNNTSQASAGSGALTTIRTEAFNVQAGWQYLPTPEERLLFLASEAVIVSITAPADAVTMSGTLVFEEL
jgi:hypothetical protein